MREGAGIVILLSGIMGAVQGLAVPTLWKDRDMQLGGIGAGKIFRLRLSHWRLSFRCTAPVTDGRGNTE
jgi:hypothetical protein